MQLDVDDLRDFYATPLGQTVRRLLTHRIRARWRGLQRSTLIGLGYSTPYLGAFRGEAQRLGALMPDSQGAMRWPRDGASQSVLVDDDRLPLADESVDRLLAVHCLEVAESTRHLLREMWRVLGARGPHDARRAQSPRRLGAPRQNAVRARAPLQPPPAR